MPAAVIMPAAAIMPVAAIMPTTASGSSALISPFTPDLPATIPPPAALCESVQTMYSSRSLVSVLCFYGITIFTLPAYVNTCFCSFVFLCIIIILNYEKCTIT